MDPVTAGFNCAIAAMTLMGKVWDAMSPDEQKAAASGIAKFNSDIAAFLNGVQSKIQGLVAPTQGTIPVSK